MKWGVRGKLLAASVLVVVLAVTILALFLERDVHQRLVREELAQLQSYVTWLAFALDPDTSIPISDEIPQPTQVPQPTPTDSTALSSTHTPWVSHPRLLTLIDTFATLMTCRVTLIDNDGTVVLDSAFGRDTVADLDNHNNRPEIALAKQYGSATAIRYSTTLQETQMYAAATIRSSVWEGFVRVSRSLVGIERSLTRVRVRIVVGALAAAIVAMLMSWFATALLRRELKVLLRTATAITEGKEFTRANVAAPAEIGHIAGSFNQLSDELARTVAELAEQRDRFVAVLDSMTDAVIVCDGSQRIVLLNPAARKLLSLEGPPDGTTLLEAIRSEALSRIVADARRSHVASGEIRFHAKRRNTWVIVSAVHQTTRDNTVIVLHDVTELRHLERVRKEFFANVSHELRTPVTTISIGAETLSMDDWVHPERSRKLAQSIYRNAQRLGRIITDMLDLARIEAGLESFQQFDVQLTPIVDTCLEIFAERIEQNNQRVVLNVPEVLRVRANDRAVERVLANLIDNATKFTPENGEFGVMARIDGPIVRIEVWDNGPGIFADAHQRVFERFYRADPSRDRDSGGSGLGLAIVRHLVESMGGTVGVTPNKPTGCRFWFTLPLSDDGPGEPEPPSNNPAPPTSVT